MNQWEKPVEQILQLYFLMSSVSYQGLPFERQRKRKSFHDPFKSTSKDIEQGENNLENDVEGQTEIPHHKGMSRSILF